MKQFLGAIEQRPTHGPVYGPNGFNANGITWGRWYAAATFGLKYCPDMRVKGAMLAAWRAGEDPTDWASSFAPWRERVATLPRIDDGL